MLFLRLHRLLQTFNPFSFVTGTTPPSPLLTCKGSKSLNSAYFRLFWILTSSQGSNLVPSGYSTSHVGTPLSFRQRRIRSKLLIVLLFLTEGLASSFSSSSNEPLRRNSFSSNDDTGVSEADDAVGDIPFFSIAAVFPRCRFPSLVLLTKTPPRAYVPR